MTKDQIKAKVLYNWDHIKRCKFYSGDEVVVVYVGKSYSENYLRKYLGKAGKIVAVSYAVKNHIRSKCRMFTRYFVEFENGECAGFHSHYIETKDRAVEIKLQTL